ncbi:MAG TPA: hypothetical protein VFC01_24740 [Mycobacterium sp.]|nr:hypothetical protein [Mycobacterium sp.]
MTDQRQSTRDQWAPPAPTLEQADPDWTGPASSSQNSAAKDLTDAERPAVDGTVYESAAHESAIDESVPADRSDLDDADPEHADLEHADLEHADPEPAVGVAPVPDAVAATDTEADTVDRGDFDPPGGVAQDAARIDGPNGAYGIKGNPADAPAAVEEQEPTEEHGSVAVATDTGQPVDGFDERVEPADGEVPLVPVPGDDAVASDVTGSGELLPGDVPDEPGLALLDGDTTGRFRDRWQELQLRFVDDPHTAADQAGALVDEVVAALRDAVDGQRSALEEWQSGDGIDTHFGDTERLRVAVRRYRDFLDRLLGL